MLFIDKESKENGIPQISKNKEMIAYTIFVGKKIGLLNFLTNQEEEFGFDLTIHRIIEFAFHPMKDNIIYIALTSNEIIAFDFEKKEKIASYKVKSKIKFLKISNDGKRMVTTDEVKKFEGIIDLKE
jgi:hypothetical protein